LKADGRDTRVPRGRLNSASGGFDERIEDPEAADLLAVLEVFGIEDGAAGLQSGSSERTGFYFREISSRT
jgi:hypothetical protein